MNKWVNRVISGVEYLMALIFIESAIQLFILPSIDGDGMMFVLGDHVALVIYALWFIIWALILISSKIAKKRKWHLRALTVLYLTAVYTAVLTALLVGWVDAIDDIAIAAVLAGCWLRWKFKTEYIDPEQFYSEVRDLGGDPPPLP